jgi:hypothetical protein
MSSGSAVQRIYTVHDYPLKRKVFSRVDIDPTKHAATYALLLYYHALVYQEIYYREDTTSGANPPGNNPGTYNRVTTNGPYGIWGHRIGDLCYNGNSTVTTFVDADGVASALCAFDCDS